MGSKVLSINNLPVGMCAIVSIKSLNLMLLHADIDECTQGIDGCDQMCTNQNGSYSCYCGSGYQLSSDRHGCQDINECALDIDECEQLCTNTIGSYVCSCDTGYYLENDGKLCNGQLNFFHTFCYFLSQWLAI